MTSHIGPWRRFVRAFDRAFAGFANSGLIRFITQLCSTPDLDVTLCLERMQADDPAELVIGLRWLGSMQTPHTSRAATRVFELLRHEDAAVRTEAEAARSALRERFGDPW